jgi:hypothetical protein
LGAGGLGFLTIEGGLGWGLGVLKCFHSSCSSVTSGVAIPLPKRAKVMRSPRMDCPISIEKESARMKLTGLVVPTESL